MAIAIPSVTRYIDQSRKNTLANTIGNYINAAVTGMNNQDYKFYEPNGTYATTTEVGVYLENTIYALPIGCVDLEKGGSNPFGAWENGSYVLIGYKQDSGYTYGFMFKDRANHYMLPTISTKVEASKIVTGTEAASFEFSTATAPTTGTVGTALTAAFGSGKTAVAVSYCESTADALFRR